jgi:hypothetical protein
LNRVWKVILEELSQIEARDAYLQDRGAIKHPPETVLRDPIAIISTSNDTSGVANFGKSGMFFSPSKKKGL